MSDQTIFYTVARRSFATISLVTLPDKTIALVRDIHRYGSDAKWKFIGGEGLLGETPIRGAVRENEEESGILIPENLLIPYGGPIAKYNYDIFRFTAELQEMPKDCILKRRADEGEDTALWTALEIRQMADDLASPLPWENRDFLRMHYELFYEKLRELAPDQLLSAAA